MLPGLTGPLAGASASGTLSYVGTSVSTSSLSSYTFSNASIGGPGLIAVFVSARDTGSSTISSVTIGGSAASTAVKISSTDYPCGIFYRFVSSGTTATIVVTMSETVTNCAIAVYRITGNSADAPFHTASSTDDGTSMSVSLNIPQSGLAIAGAHLNTASNTTWTNVTENVDAAQGTAGYTAASAMNLAEQTGRSITAAASVKIQTMVAASWR